jgi:transcriptional regulator with XRE-family HTH domain
MTLTPTYQTLALAKRRGYTDDDIARICGVSPVTVWRWERGDLHPKYDEMWPLLVEVGIAQNETH